jgi:hypothetical protein
VIDAMNPHQVAALALRAEAAANRLHARVDGVKGPTVKMAGDELRKIAEEMLALAAVARTHHAHLVHQAARRRESPLLRQPDDVRAEP